MFTTFRPYREDANSSFAQKKQFPSPPRRAPFQITSPSLRVFHGTSSLPKLNKSGVSHTIAVEPDAPINPPDDEHCDSTVRGRDLDDMLEDIQPNVDMPMDQGDITPAGLTYPLYRHQEVALAWMKQMEGDINKGGILADEMGLGKTVSTLALILANQATSRWRVCYSSSSFSLLKPHLLLCS